MKYRYLFKEFGINQTEQDLNDWLEKSGAEGWDAVNVTAVPRLVGGGIVGGLNLPTQTGFSYAVLMKRGRE